MPDSDLLKLTISEVAPLIRAREVSPVDLAEAALAEAERRQPTLNSFITIMREQALRPGRRSRGIPVPGRVPGPAARHTDRHQGQHRHGRYHHHGRNQGVTGPRSPRRCRGRSPLQGSRRHHHRQREPGGVCRRGDVQQPALRRGAQPLERRPHSRRLQRRRRRQRGCRRHLRVPGNRLGRVSAPARARSAVSLGSSRPSEESANAACW